MVQWYLVFWYFLTRSNLRLYVYTTLFSYHSHYPSCWGDILGASYYTINHVAIMVVDTTVVKNRRLRATQLPLISDNCCTWLQVLEGCRFWVCEGWKIFRCPTQSGLHATDLLSVTLATFSLVYQATSILSLAGSWGRGFSRFSLHSTPNFRWARELV